MMFDATGRIENKGEVMVFSGLGKGKTIAALGVALRMIGIGRRVIFIHFTGPQTHLLDEVRFTAAFGRNWRTIVIITEVKYNDYLNEFVESVDSVRKALAMARDLWLYECDLLVLDDIGSHLESESLDPAQVLAIIDERPQEVSILLTGRSFPEPIMQKANLITHFHKVKEPSADNAEGTKYGT